MKNRSLVTGVLALALLMLAWRAGGVRGLALIGSALVLWLLLTWSQVMRVMRRASENPVGFVGNAVELNTRLRRRDSLLRVVAITQSLGKRLSAPDAQPEIYCWTDSRQACVTARFEGGRLKEWRLERPQQDGDAAALEKNDEMTPAAPDMTK